MSEEVITHGISYIWNLEIEEYKNIYLSDFFDDTVIDFEYLHCDEMYTEAQGLRRIRESVWQIMVPIKFDINKDLLRIACKEIAAHSKFLVSYFAPCGKYDDSMITVCIDKDMSIFEAYNYACEKRDEVIDYVSSLMNKRLATTIRNMVNNRLPVYVRAMKKVELELSNFITDEKANSRKIIDICSRAKTVESIQEKVYRKNICQFEIFERFDDIAGVRCTCEFLSDVYEVLEYIKQNPLFHVQSIEDKIALPSKEGYRGIHVIVTTDVFYRGAVYENIKVEMQIRTAFQNAWSMKTHQLTYKQENISVEMSNAMRKMSDALKEADEVAQSIKDTLQFS